MRHLVPPLPNSTVHPGCARVAAPGRCAAGWQRARRSLVNVLVEAGRYACGCPRSRLHQRAALRELDARLLRDIGVEQGATWSGPGDPGIRPEGHR